MQDLEIVVVNFGNNAPIYTEAVFPDPEVRSIAAEKEDKARQRRREARRRARQEQRNANTTTTTASRPPRRNRTSSTQSSTASTTQASSRASNANSNTASTSGQSSHTQPTNSESDFDSDSDAENAPQETTTSQAENNRDNSEEEWITCSIPRNSNEQVQISVHSQQRTVNTSTTTSASSQHLTVPQPTRRRIGAKRFRWFSRNVPLANQNRHHPNEDIEECWLSPEPSPQQSPIRPPVVERLAKKWRNKSLPVVLNGCNTCRGDVAIHSHQRPRLIQALFQQVVFVISVVSLVKLY